MGAEEGSCRAATLDHTDDCTADSDEVVCVKPWGGGFQMDGCLTQLQEASNCCNAACTCEPFG